MKNWMTTGERRVLYAITLLCVAGMVGGGWMMLQRDQEGDAYFLLGAAVLAYNSWNTTRCLLMLWEDRHG